MHERTERSARDQRNTDHVHTDKGERVIRRAATYVLLAGMTNGAEEEGMTVRIP